MSNQNAYFSGYVGYDPIDSFTPGWPLTQLILQALTREDQHSFARFYDIYATLFPLENEREPPEAFTAILDLNENYLVQRRYGPYREVVAAARLWEAGPVAGGHVFGVTTSPEHHAAGFPASVQAIYTFLLPAVRGHLNIAEIKRYSESIACTTFGLEPTAFPQRPLMIFEVNNPLRMTEQEIADDTLSSGLHPARRYMFWRRSGFAPLDFAYVQPRLRHDAEPVRYLDLFCSANLSQPISSTLLLKHLRAFISVSVLKGRDAATDPEFCHMVEALAARPHVTFVRNDDPHLMQIAALGRAVRVPKSQAPQHSG